MAALIAAGVGSAVGPATAAVGTGTFHFVEPPVRVVDTTSGVKPQAGVPVLVAATAQQYQNIWVIDPDGEGTLSLGPCGAAPTSVVLHFERGETAVNRARVAPGWCLTPSVATHLAMDRVADEDPAPTAGGLRYVPLPESQVLLDTFESETPLPSSTLTLAGADAGVPVGAAGVALDLGLFGAGALRAYPCGPPPALADVVDDGFGHQNVDYVPVDAAGAFCLQVTATEDAVDAYVEVLGYFTADATSGGVPPPTFVYQAQSAPGFVPATPTRVLDTRTGVGVPQVGKVRGGGVLVLDLSASIGPDTAAVVMNLTATAPEGPGYLTAYPCDEDRPEVSNLNFTSGVTVPNLVTVGVSFDAEVCIFAYSTTHVVADLAGRFDFDGGVRYGPLTPDRVLDTRTGNGAPVGKLTAGGVLRVQVAGRAGMPVGSAAAALNVTTTGPNGPGFLTAYPCNEPRPDASNLNYARNQTVANSVTVKLAPDGSVCLFSYATTHVIVDVAGFYGVDGTAGFLPEFPYRAFDTRDDLGRQLLAGERFPLDLFYGPPADSGITALSLNLTATNPASPGFLTAYSCDQARPEVSNLNYVAGQTVANSATVKLSAAGELCLFTLARSGVIVDVFGEFTTRDFWFAELTGADVALAPRRASSRMVGASRTAARARAGSLATRP